MNDLENLFKLLVALEEVSREISEGTSKEYEIGNYKISISNLEDSFSLQIEADHEEFDDSEVKELVSEFLESIENLDGDVYNEALDAISEDVNLKEFDRLTHLDKFTEDEANTVEKLIDQFSTIIADKLKEKINRLVISYSRF